MQGKVEWAQEARWGTEGRWTCRWFQGECGNRMGQEGQENSEDEIPGASQTVVLPLGVVL